MLETFFSPHANVVVQLFPCVLLSGMLVRRPIWTVEKPKYSCKGESILYLKPEGDFLSQYVQSDDQPTYVVH